MQALRIQRKRYESSTLEREVESKLDLRSGRCCMRCPLCGRKMEKLGGACTKKVTEPVYYCEKHGLLNKSMDTKAKTSETAKNPQWLETD